MKKGWDEKTLGDICEIERGGSPRPIDTFLTDSPDGINWIKIGDTKGITKYIFETKEKIKPEGARRSRVVYEGDFILSNSMSFGHPFIMKTTGCIHDGWLVLRGKLPNIDKDFLYHVLDSHIVFKQFDNLAAGSTVRNLNIDLVKKVKIPLPPLLEQHRIVSILDESFAAIAKAKENAEKNLVYAREVFESHLESIFAIQGNGWELKKLSEVAVVKDGTHDSPKYISEGIPFVTQKNIKETGFSLLDTRFISIQDHENFFRRSNASYGDILISMIGANRGMACLVDTDRIFSIKNVGLVKKSTEINQQYLLYFLKSTISKSYVQDYSKGGAQEFIGLTELRNFPILIPPLISQSTIVSKLDSLSFETIKLESIYKQKLKDLEELKKSLLERAFRGELVSDEGIRR